MSTPSPGSSPELVLWGGRVIDPAHGQDGVADVAISAGRIVGVAPSIPGGARREDCRGLWVVPGLIDIHCHFREPGNDEAETIASGLAAAAAGGFTTVAVMPNTRPAIDTPAAVAFQLETADRARLGRLVVVAAATRGRQGVELCDYRALAAAGAVGFSDDGDTIADAGVMARALTAAEAVGRPLLVHAVDPELARGGAMRAGATADALGVQGIPDLADERIIERDLELLATCGGDLHVQHLATAGSVALLAAARSRGLRATAEVTPHHLVLADTDVARYGTNAKMAPPLASVTGREALVAGLAGGIIEVIASDHAPHTAATKARPLAEAPNGIIGLETSLPVLLAELVERRRIAASRIIAALTVGPARLLGLDAGDLGVGRPADLTVIDPSAEVILHAGAFRSRSRNTPFEGWRGRGRVQAVYVGGRKII